MIHISEAKKLEIQAQVNDLLVSLSGDNNKVSLPVDLTTILSNQNIKLREKTFADKKISGAYDRKNQTIWIAKSEPYERKVFTVAHELGHFLLHEGIPQEIFWRNQLVQIAQEKDINEVEANFFAACLLMPEKIIRNYWELSHELDILAKIFGVSNTAVYWRLKNLGLMT